ncbi:DUF2577 family protein [Clostridiaceae bacterium M8S5]|nr:DUF2577 family protein [Clostridiaceae bacterium M8S5]
MNGINILAKLFRERDNIEYMGPLIGEVTNAPPEIKITIGDKIVLTKENLFFSSHILDDYEREFEIEDSDDNTIKLEQKDAGTTDEGVVPESDTTYSTYSHKHDIKKINVATSFTSNGVIKFTNTIADGDKVILIPTANEMVYYVVDKAVSLNS